MPTSDLKIRKAKPKDWKIIQALNYEVYEAVKEFDPYLDLDHPFTPEAIKSYKNTVSDNKRCVLIAEINGKPVGYLNGKVTIFSYRKGKMGEIDDIGVSTRFRSQGIGKKLVLSFRKWCKENKLDRIYVSTYYKHEQAMRFYEKMQLKPVGIELEGKV